MSLIKDLSKKKYNKYFIDVYNLRTQTLLRDILKNFTPIKNRSILSFDLILSQYLSEFRKKIVLMYSILDLESPSLKKEFLRERLYKSFPLTYERFIDDENVLTITNNLLSNAHYFTYNNSINFSVPLSFLFAKMRLLGFIHPHKNRPIGNARLLFFEDLFIIKSFGYIAYSIMHWYRFCYNFIDSRFLIELLRESCFLTLCRKHNKNKNWAYTTYSSDLILIQGLFNTKSFFPTRAFVSNLGRKKIFYNNFRFDEKFFLDS